MDTFISQIDALIDVQRPIENYYSYADKYITKVGDKIEGGKWRVVLKWSTKVGDACVEDSQNIVAEGKKI